jgi:hypothetical protein
LNENKDGMTDVNICYFKKIRGVRGSSFYELDHMVVWKFEFLMRSDETRPAGAIGWGWRRRGGSNCSPECATA